MKKQYFLVFLIFLFTKTIFAQPDNFVGEIRIFGGSYAPAGWLKCEGQLINISDNADLYAILGTTYGGDGITTFALPDLRERMAVGNANNHPVPNLSTNQLGQTGGQTTVVLVPQNLPPHSHSVNLKFSSKEATSSEATSNSSFAVPKFVNTTTTKTIKNYSYWGPDIYTANYFTISAVGNAAPVALKTEQPYLVCNYIIATTGFIPTPQ